MRPVRGVQYRLAYGQLLLSLATIHGSRAQQANPAVPMDVVVPAAYLCSSVAVLRRSYTARSLLRCLFTTLFHLTSPPMHS